jgi:acetyl-CoA acyltransferase
MKEVVIAGYLRTAQSRSRPNDPARDVFAKLRGDELLAKLLPEVIKRTGIDPKEINDFLVGCATGVGEQWSYGGRIPIFLANLPETISAKYVDQQCGSAMAGIHIGFMEIAQEFADIVLVGGYEHMTRVPMGRTTTERGYVAPNMSLFADPAYSKWDMMTTMNMGLTAEKLFKKTGYTKEDMDKWGVRSHQRASKAQKEGFFDGEILPIDAIQDDGKVLTVKKDQAVRDDATLEGMASLKPAFKKDGVITAGNSSPLNAAATSMVLMSKETAKKKGIKPLATIRSIGFLHRGPKLYQRAGVGPGKGQRHGRRGGHRARPRSDWDSAGGDPRTDPRGEGGPVRRCQRVRRRRPRSRYAHRERKIRIIKKGLSDPSPAPYSGRGVSDSRRKQRPWESTTSRGMTETSSSCFLSI